MFRIYAISHYMDPRFKDQFVANRIEFSAKIELWLKAEVNFNEENEALPVEVVENGK